MQVLFEANQPVSGHAMTRVLTKVGVDRDRPCWVQPWQIVEAMDKLDAV